MKKYSDVEQQINNVLAHHDQLLAEIAFPNAKAIDEQISKSIALLKSIGIDSGINKRDIISSQRKKTVMVMPSWDAMCRDAEISVGTNHDLAELFTVEELGENESAIRALNKEYDMIHQLDETDVGIAVIGGLLGAMIDILLVGVPQKTSDGLDAGPLSNYIRDYFDKRYPEEEMAKLANSKQSKVPFDAQDNRHTKVRVEGLSAYYHRMLQLGHDPILGFVFGVIDIINGTMTTIDKKGNFVCQVMDNYSNRTEMDIFKALCKQILHLKTDLTTSMGLPAPLMSLFNFLQFGNIGEENLTIAEIVQGMYYEGYDFVHFCSMSIPTMITEVVIRLAYSIKRIKEGNRIKDSIPFSLNRENHPKLATMLFLGHSASIAINSGKVVFTKNPMAINYSQWIAFAKYSYSQLKWGLLDKSILKEKYVMGKLNEELNEVFHSVNKGFDDFSSEYVLLME